MTSDKDGKRDETLGPGQEQLADTISEVLELFIDSAKSAAAKKGGTVQPEDLEALYIPIRDRTDPRFTDFIRSRWEELQKIAEENIWHHQRNYPLERMIVQRFEHLFPAPGEPPEAGKTLSRRVVPAFLTALQQMIGNDLFHDYEERSRQVVETIRARKGDKFDWELVYGDPHANLLALDIIVFIARYFEDVPRRRRWMQDVFAKAMPADRAGRETEWSFDDASFHLLMRALYTELRVGLEDAETAASLERRYGGENMDTVRSVIAALDEDRQKLGLS